MLPFTWIDIRLTGANLPGVVVEFVSDCVTRLPSPAAACDNGHKTWTTASSDPFVDHLGIHSAAIEGVSQLEAEQIAAER